MAASYISVPRDLTKVKSKVMFNLTKRQLICFSVAALFGVPSFFLIKQVASVSTAAMGMMVIMMPFFFLAMYEKNNQHLEVIMGHLIEATFIRPKQRPYQTDNNYSALERYKEAQREIDEIIMYAQATR
ncbi:MAG: PrgI family protein, partial [Bacteroidaceae bacterium]|nr:PrgI family protein [Bacteroidaceae bacterium]